MSQGIPVYTPSWISPKGDQATDEYDWGLISATPTQPSEDWGPINTNDETIPKEAENWGFLLPDYDSRSEATRGPIEMKKSAYYDYQTRQWTVLEKRVTAPSAQQSSESDEVADSKSVAGVTAATHQTLMDSIPANTAFLTSNRAYGARKTLECFGTSEYGVRAIQKNMAKSLEFRPMHPF